MLKARAELLGGKLAGIARDDDAAHQKPQRLQVVDELQRVVGVGDAEVRAHLLVFDVAGIDREDDLGLVLERLQEPQLDVGVVAGEAPGGVEVVHQLPAEFQIELAVFGRPAANLRRLLAQVLFVVESDFHGVALPVQLF